MYYVITYGNQYLSKFGTGWTFWSQDEKEARVFSSLTMAEDIAILVGGNIELRCAEE